MKMTRHAYFPLALTPAQEANVKNGATYYNVHTTAYGGGEISGVINPKPKIASGASAAVASLSAAILLILSIALQA